MPDTSPLFPPIDAYTSGFLDVGDGHQIYFEESGSPRGIPLVHVHGGPGDCVDPKNRQYYDPDKYRIILFDQRGCGKSLPARCLEANTTQHLIADMEQLRAHLNVEKWVVSGGSWGSTLALLYAQAHAEYVCGLLLRSIFLAEEAADAWMYDAQGAAQFFPDAYDQYMRFLPTYLRAHPQKAYEEMIHGEDDELARAAAVSLLTWQGVLCGMEGNMLAKEQERSLAMRDMTEQARKEARLGFEDFAYSHCLLETHYARHHFYVTEGQILDQMDKIKHIPAIIIHGRYDMLCPAMNAWRLHEAYSESELVIVPDAGHSGSELAAEFVRAVKLMADTVL